MKNSISLKEFAERISVSEEWILRRQHEVPGIEKVGDEVRVRRGTRWPLKMNFKMDTAEEKRYVLLRAISEFKYIDAKMLKIEEKSFELMLREFLKTGIIAKNGTGNTYGANGFDCTSKGDDIIKKRKSRAMEELSRIIGTAIGAILSSS